MSNDMMKTSITKPQMTKDPVIPKAQSKDCITMRIKNETRLSVDEIFLIETKSPLFTETNKTYINKNGQEISAKSVAFLKYIDDNKEAASSRINQMLKPNNKFITFQFKPANRDILNICNYFFKDKENKEIMMIVLSKLKEEYRIPPQNISTLVANLLIFFPPNYVINLIYLMFISPKYKVNSLWRKHELAILNEYHLIQTLLKTIDGEYSAYLEKKRINFQKLFSDISIALTFRTFDIEHSLTFFERFLEDGNFFMVQFVISLLISIKPLLKYKAPSFSTLSTSSLFGIPFDAFYSELCIKDESFTNKKTKGFKRNEKAKLLFNATMKYMSDGNVIGENGKKLVEQTREKMFSKIISAQTKKMVYTHLNKYITKNKQSEFFLQCIDCNLMAEFQCEVDNHPYCQSCAATHKADHKVIPLVLLKEIEFL